MSREKRKDEHVELAARPEAVSAVSHFDDISFVHHSLPELSVQDVEMSVKFGGLSMNAPVYINAMTGGSHKTGEINALLADIASSAGIAMAVGSQHAGLRNESLADSYRVVRKVNPNGLIFANIGADAPLDFALRAVDMLEANALQIHLNVPQEVVMPEGERNFSGWLSQIGRIVHAVSVPVIVKEVGFGMSADTLHMLSEAGVKHVDVSGRGGTNFVWIENERRDLKDYSYLKGWGQSTVLSLLEAQEFILKDALTVFASGGIRNPLDIVKCLSLGAKAVGIAGPILRLLQNEGADRAVAEVTEWIAQIKSIQTILGCRMVGELQKAAIVATGEVREWCELRGIDTVRLARRSRLSR